MSDFFIGLACGVCLGFFFGLVIICGVMITKIRDNYLPGRENEKEEGLYEKS